MHSETLDMFEGTQRPATAPHRPEPYGGTAPYVKGSETSKQAALSLEPRRGSLQYHVLACIRSRTDYGATDDELETTLHLRHQTASARRRELELKGLVVRTQHRRKTRSGRNAGVYVATEYAEAPDPSLRKKLVNIMHVPAL